jgi:ubiquinone/menaquinone biosynthesis C-methylase UbiE
MEDINWTLEDLELMDKILGPTRFNREQLDLLVNGVGNQRKVLDLCLGFGNLSKLLVEKGNIVYGLDANPATFDYTNNKMGRKANNFHTIEGDVYAIDYQEQFDVVTCASTIGGMDDLDKITSGIHRSLRKNGLAVVTGTERSKQESYIRLYGSEIMQAAESGRLRLTEDEAKRLAKMQDSNDEKEFKDSSKGMKSSLSNNGFQIIDSRDFYDGTCYYLKARKE